jgi:hypothetical protein
MSRRSSLGSRVRGQADDERAAHFRPAVTIDYRCADEKEKIVWFEDNLGVSFGRLPVPENTNHHS